MKVNVPFLKRHPLAARLLPAAIIAAPATFYFWRADRREGKALQYCIDTRRRMFEVETLLEAEGIVKKAATVERVDPLIGKYISDKREVEKCSNMSIPEHFAGLELDCESCALTRTRTEELAGEIVADAKAEGVEIVASSGETSATEI